MRWFLVILVLGAGCTVESDISILDPVRGAMLPGGKPVAVRLRAAGSGVRVNGAPLPGEGELSTSVPAADGLGFVWASRDGSDFLAVRSWHQGTYRSSYDWHPGTLSLRLGSSALDGGEASVAGLVEALLVNQELVSFVNNPLVITVSLGLTNVQVTVTVHSVKLPSAAVDVTARGGKLSFALALKDVLVKYSTAASILGSTGTATYASMNISGEMTPTPTACPLADIKLAASTPQIQDTMLPALVMEALVVLFQSKINSAIRDAVVNVAQSLVIRLIMEIQPTVGVAFKRPVTQASALSSVVVDEGAVTLVYRTLIQAALARVAQKGQAVLVRATRGPVLPAKADLSAWVGSGLVNQFIHAVWDAGNFEEVRFTRGELEGLGMKELSFPYTMLDHVELRLLLPPLLEWTSTGPVLAVGGVEALVEVDNADDPRAWSAATIPVALVASGNNLRLVHDASRSIALARVGFDRMNTAADHDEVHRILQTAVPGVVKKVFGDLPQVVLPRIALTRLDGSAGPVVTPVLTTITPGPDHWVVGLGLKKGG